MNVLRAMSLMASVTAIGVTSELPQDYRARFEIVAPSDTSFTMVLGDARWVEAGMTGFVVDPRQRDEAVAQFRVKEVSERTAVATITGMTSGVTVFHMAVMTVPGRSWLSRHLWWIGTGLGIAVGFVIGRS